MPASSIADRLSAKQFRCRASLALAGSLLCTLADARVLTLHADRLHAAEADATGIDVTLHESEPGSLKLDIRQLDVPALALSGRVEWACALARTDGDARTCSGPVHLTPTQGEPQTADLSARVAKDAIELAFARDESRARIVVPVGTAEPRKVELEKVPSAWLRAPLARAWPAGELRDGRVGGSASIATDGAVDGRFAFEDLSVNTNDGALAAEALDATGTLRADGLSAAPHVVLDATLASGRLRLGDVRFDVPDAPIALGADVTANGDTWIAKEIRWRDPGTLEFTAAGTYAPAAQDALRTLEVHVVRASFPAVQKRYAQTLLAAQGWGALSAKGDLAGDFAIDGTPTRVALNFQKFDLDDGKRFSLRGLDGAFDWSVAEDRPPSMLRWKALRIDTLALGGAQAKLRTRAGRIELAAPASIPVASGALELKRLSFDPRTTKALAAQADFALRKIGYDSADGTIAASGVTVEGSLQLDGTLQVPHAEVRADFRGGEMLYGPFYIKLPATPVHATVDARLDGARWNIAKFEWNDADVLVLDGSATIAPAEPRIVTAIDLQLHRATLAPALDRYARSWLAAKGYPKLEADGAVSGVLRYDAEGLRQLALSAERVDIDDGAERFRFTGVDGGFDWRYSEDAPPTSLAWKTIELFKVPLDATTLDLRSSEAAITLAKPASIGVLGGQVRLEKLSLQPRSARGERYAASFAIAAIDMAQLSAAFGWPTFGGNLSGGIPEIELAGDTIELHGGLDLYVFDGYLGISGLTLERPFGIAPSMHADAHFENFDLDRLTSAFSFGGMSGRLDGKVQGLRLVDWSPVAFDAELRSDKGGRMSYKAVNDVTALGGGGGLGANLQTMALKMFDTFGYRRLGIRCTLAAEICTMGGVEDIAQGRAAGSGADSYTIVEGSGIPRIEIIGHRRRVAWPTLVDRLIEATKGQGPIIQ